MQSAYDRDEYVKIIYENIIEGAQLQFLKYNSSFVSHFGQKYDYYSLMHYPKDAFSKNDEPTIVPVVRTFFVRILITMKF